ncbi:hypothetical protein [Rossellomorea sp. NS-SX7]|uniref:hypothetical protein n=1 Tax=Rossellomorea sp. NS-SX7 TaxID=3463856 RepID=UPI004058F54B
MITFETNEWSKWKIEQEIMNSNPSYNLLSKNKRSIDINDIRSEFEESKRLNTKRLFIKEDESYIGLVDYCLENPSDHIPWISLYVFHKSFQGSGKSHEAYMLIENLIKREGKRKLRLAVHKEAYWTNLGFATYKEVIYEDKPHFCMHKDL